MHTWRHGHVFALGGWQVQDTHPPIAGPITVLNKTIYDILRKTPDAPDYLHFMGWVYLWGAIFHWASALLNCECKTSLKTAYSFFRKGVTS